jgi:hypothetical protein
VTYRQQAIRHRSWSISIAGGLLRGLCHSLRHSSTYKAVPQRSRRPAVHYSASVYTDHVNEAGESTTCFVTLHLVDDEALKVVSAAIDEALKHSQFLV